MTVVEIHDEFILCLLCGKQLRSAGAHFTKKHGFPALRSRTERQQLYGLKQGSRLAIMEVREALSKYSSQRTPIMNSRNPEVLEIAMSRRKSLLNITIPLNENQIESRRKNIKKNRERRQNRKDI